MIYSELKKVGIAFIAIAIVFQIVFFRESVLVNLRVVGAFFWSFVLPGYAVMLYWKDELDFLQRIIIGAAVGIAVVGILSYYVSLLGLHVMYHTILLPALITGGFFLWLK